MRLREPLDRGPRRGSRAGVEAPRKPRTSGHGHSGAGPWDGHQLYSSLAVRQADPGHTARKRHDERNRWRWNWPDVDLGRATVEIDLRYGVDGPSFACRRRWLEETAAAWISATVSRLQSSSSRL